MAYLSVIAASYLMWFYPEFFSRPLLVFPSLAVISMIFLMGKREAGFLVIVSLVFHVAVSALTVSLPSVSFEGNNGMAIRGTVIQDSQIKSGRRFGCRLLLDTVIDERDSVFEGRGSVFVMLPPADFYYGDRIEARGDMNGDVFYAESARLLRRPFLSSIRAGVIGFVKSRFIPLSDAGELASLLVLGTGSNGEFPLSSLARSSGLSHVLALSGMHLSIIAMILRPLLHFLCGRRKGEIVLSLVLFLFSFLSGWRPSLLRAFIFRMAMKRMGKEMAFIISFVLLLVLSPSSALDLGALYSFLSLGGIFLLSEPLCRAMRFFLPIPYSFAISVAASLSALIFSIPLTIAVFGDYQLGSVITSFPFNAAISLYMILSLVVIVFPFSGKLLEVLFLFIRKGFELAGAIPESSGIIPYIILVIITLMLLSSGFIIEKRTVAKK